MHFQLHNADDLGNFIPEKCTFFRLHVPLSSFQAYSPECLVVCGSDSFLSFNYFDLLFCLFYIYVNILNLRRFLPPQMSSP